MKDEIQKRAHQGNLSDNPLEQWTSLEDLDSDEKEKPKPKEWGNSWISLEDL